MRLSSILLAATAPMALPLSAWADDLVLDAPVTAVEVYPSGAKVTRSVRFDVPAGDHQVILPDLPAGLRSEGAKLVIEGAVSIGPESLSSLDAPLFEVPQSADLTAALAALQAAQSAYQQVKVTRARAQAKADAAKAQMAYAAKLGQGEGPSPDPSALAEIATLVAETTAAAVVAQAEAEAEITALSQDLDRAQKAQTRARAQVDRLRAAPNGVTQLSVQLMADAAGEASLSYSYFVSNAGWRPVYDLYLDREGDGSLRIERGASVAQQTGEHWRGAELTLSTLSPSNSVAANEPSPWLRRIFDKGARPMASASYDKRSVALDSMMEPPMAELAAPSPMTAGANLGGLNVTYSYGGTVDLLSGAAQTRIPLDALSFDAPQVIAVGAPLTDTSAYVRASFSNDSGEAILPGEGTYYLDGVLVGSAWLSMIAAGEDVDLGFGEIRGLQLERIVKDREEGDRGIISRSNEETEQVTLKVTNLTGEAWDMLLLDRVPVSEQEDLKVTWQATPQPSQENYDDKRGVLAWETELAAGQVWEVQLSHRLSWPEGQILQ